mmetsp:Transcript_75797/g.195306  ORF Transcript_75797/g.195306 Transcript_75797/m.195306 type:complete len:235 (-) Transcript_75797:2675-3379(-)
MRMIFMLGSVLKATSESFRAWMDMPPRSTTHARPARFRRNSMSSNMAPNCEKTMALAVGSLCSIRLISSMSASILVLLWKSATLIFCRMFLFPIFGSLEDVVALEVVAALSGSASIGGAFFPTRRCRTAGAFSGESRASSQFDGAAETDDSSERLRSTEEGCDALLSLVLFALGVAIDEAAAEPAALRLPADFFSPFSSPSSSTSSGSSRSTTSFEKHTGQPTPPEGSAGASTT